MVTPLLDQDMYLDDPLESFKGIYKEKHDQNVKEFFDQLTEKSLVNVEENVDTVKKIRKLESERDGVKKRLNAKKTWRGLLIFLTILALAGLGYSVYAMIEIAMELLYILGLSLGAVVAGISLFTIFKVLNKQIKVLTKEHRELDNKVIQLIQVAYAQMKPLNDLFYVGMNKELFQKTLPLIQFDQMFESKRLDYMINNFGYSSANDLNRSTIFVQSGEIKGNPFFFGHDLIHRMETQDYTGSITIHWTTTSYSNGKRTTQHHTQTLTATLTKPCPRYYNQYSLTYANDAAPDLIFSREDSDAEHMSEKKIDKMVDRQIKKLEKQSQKDITKGGTYTVMGNSEFEVLFGANNRNNEVQFRLLFTPLAQKQLLALMKEKEYGYGDDFDMIKHKKINRIYPEHLDDIPLDPEPKYFFGYEHAEIKNRFVMYQNSYFRSIYFAFAPLLAIPLYQQTMPKEYIYKDLYDSNVSFYEHEKVVNRMNIESFKHPLSVTRNILKTDVMKSESNKDVIGVTAYGYQTVEHIEYVTKLGGDGKFHQIPVRWLEYIPVQQTKQVEIEVVKPEEALSFQDRIRQMVEGLKNREIAEKDVYLINSLLAHVINEKK